MIIAGTGHRPNKLGGYSQSAQNKLVKIAEDWLIEHKPEKILSGMAIGWDQALAIAAVKQEIPFIAVVPFKGQERMWSKDSIMVYNALLLLAKDIVVVSQGDYSYEKMQLRNQYLVDNSDKILAMYDGSEGGTRNCIAYARRKLKPVINLFDKYNI